MSLPRHRNQTTTSQSERKGTQCPAATRQRDLSHTCVPQRTLTAKRSNDVAKGNGHREQPGRTGEQLLWCSSEDGGGKAQWPFLDDLSHRAGVTTAKPQLPLRTRENQPRARNYAATDMGTSSHRYLRVDREILSGTPFCKTSECVVKKRRNTEAPEGEPFLQSQCLSSRNDHI